MEITLDQQTPIKLLLNIHKDWSDMSHGKWREDGYHAAV